MDIFLRYVGRVNPTGDREHFPGVPSRDLTAAEVADLGRDADELAATDLYELVEEDDSRPVVFDEVMTGAAEGDEVGD